MTIEVTCQCGRSYKIPAEHAGKKATCKACGEKFIVESSSELDGFKLVPAATVNKPVDENALLESFHDPVVSEVNEQPRKRASSKTLDLLPAWKLCAISIGIGLMLGIVVMGIIAVTSGDVPPTPAFSFLMLIFAYCGFMMGALWRIFEKAGYHGGASLIPLYNLLVLFEIAGLPVWLPFVLLVPGFNIIPILLLNYGLAKNFGQGILFAAGIFFFGVVLVPLLAFGDYEYEESWSLTF